MSPMDDRGRKVTRFMTELRNAGRLGAFADLIVGMYASDEWREYTTAVGNEQWLESEFDYFLIACDASHTDVQRILSWDSAKAADVASGMMSDDPEKRRPLETAASSWRSPTGASLVDIAQRNGWINSRGVLRPAPIPVRARTKLIHGVSRDEHAKRQREERIEPKRRKEIEAEYSAFVDAMTADELRYVRDLISATLSAAQADR